MFITNITSDAQGLCNIYIDELKAITIPEYDVTNYKLKSGLHITSDMLSTLKCREQIQKAKTVASKYLSYRSYTEKEIMLKLKSLNFQDNIVEDTLSFLKKYKFIDDYSYTNLYIKEKISLNKYGYNKIYTNLLLNGIDHNIINCTYKSLVNKGYIDEESNIIKLIIKKKLSPYDKMNKSKLIAYLHGKGYSFDSIDSAIRKISEGFYEDILER